jgi:hypothetical protein
LGVVPRITRHPLKHVARVALDPIFVSVASLTLVRGAKISQKSIYPVGPALLIYIIILNNIFNLFNLLNDYSICIYSVLLNF